MTAVEASPVPLTDSGLVKMEDRKRPAPYDGSDSAPPLKKQATSINGGSKAHPDTDMPWKDDLERFQKDAIWRQMQEYKREKNLLQDRISEMSKRTAYHDDHLRVIDVWFKQLIDEVRILAQSPEDDLGDHPPFPTSLLSSDNQHFEKHLQDWSNDIKATISHLFSKALSSNPEVSDLQRILSKLLAAQKVHIMELERSRTEKDQLEERLESASLRYMLAEKRIDRAKSMTVAKLERQAILGAVKPSSSEGGPVKREDGSTVNGVVENGDAIADLEETHNKVLAVSEKQKEQLETLEAENAKLMTQLTEANLKSSRLSDDDYAHTDLFKQLKSQHEDVIKRINNLEATNVQLREEAQKLQAERTAYRAMVDLECQAAAGEKESQLTNAETALARIRTTRDELQADQQMRKAAQDQEKTASNHIKELAAAREERIKAVESECDRLRLQLGQEVSEKPGFDELSNEEIRSKYQALDRQYTMLNSELSSMQTAYAKASKQASQKTFDFAALEEKVLRLTAEKSKADQKYFAAMKSKESREVEVRTLRMQNAKSSDIVSQLKESEAASRSLLANLEKQLAEMKDALTTSTTQHRASQQQVAEHNIVIEGLKNQIAELKRTLNTKDTSLSATASAHRQTELENEELKSSLRDTKTSLETWKSNGLGNQTSEYEGLRSIAICTVCRKNFKNTALKTCGHVFCNDCVEERLTSRSRKCPNCNKSFGSNDHMHVTL